MGRPTKNPNVNWEDVKKRYESKESLRSIAKDYGVAHSTIYKVLVEMGVVMRDKSNAQKNYLKKNSHQMKGKFRDKKRFMVCRRDIGSERTNKNDAFIEENK